jgi:hypothetical protein
VKHHAAVATICFTGACAQIFGLDEVVDRQGTGGSVSTNSTSTSSGGSTGPCAENDGGLLGVDGSLETGVVGGWYSGCTACLVSVAEDGTCGSRSLELSGTAPSLELRHPISPAMNGPFVLSFCMKAQTGSGEVTAVVRDGGGGDVSTPVHAMLGSTWQHVTTSSFDLTDGGSYSVNLFAPQGAVVLFDCLNVSPD